MKGATGLFIPSCTLWSLTRFPGHLSWGDDRLGEESGRCLQPGRWSSVVGRWR